MRRRNKSATSEVTRRAKSFVDKRMHIQNMFQINREIEKYRKSLENIRPRTSPSRNACYSPRPERYLQFNPPVITAVDDDDDDDNDDEKLSQQSCTINEVKTMKNIQSDGVDYEQEFHDNHNQVSRSLSSPSFVIPSECLIDESDAMDGIDVDNILPQEEQTYQSDFECESPCSSTQSELGTVMKPQQAMQEIHKSHEDVEFIIKPTIMVDIQDTIRTNVSNKFDCSNSEFVANRKIAVSQHMSIRIKKQTNEIVNENNTTDPYMNQSTEGYEIIREVFERKSRDNFLLLQKYFLRWIHFNTIEKLKRRNPAQTRLQKMEAFLQNITLERKRALNKLGKPGNSLAPCHNDEYKRMTLHDPNIQSPRLLIRTYNNK